MPVRYHLQFGSHRTTISIHEVLATLMAIKLGVDPNTKAAHSAVRQHLEQLIKPYCDPKRNYRLYKPSEFLTELAILDLVDKMLSKQYFKFMMKQKAPL